MTTPVTLRLMERDLALICTAHTYGGVTIDQLRRLHFPAGRSHTPCYERVARLVAADYLKPIGHLPVPGGVGSGRRVLAAGPSARPILAARLGLTQAELARLRRPATPTFLGHHVAINEVRLAVTLAVGAAAPRFTLVDWVGDQALHRRPLTGKTGAATASGPLPRRTVGVVPDSVFTLELGDRSRHTFWLEVDLGTVAEPRLRAKLRHYLTVVQPGAAPVPVLFVTPTAGRLAVLRSWLAAEAGSGTDPSRLWFALAGQLAPETLFTGRILYLGTRERPVALTEIQPFAGAWRATPPAGARPAPPVAPAGGRQ